jgi:hypothetical protein
VVDPSNANHVFVAYSGYREGDLSANVWETINGGSSWTNISGTLPNALVFDVKVTADGKKLYAATFGRSVWVVPLR